MLGPVGPLIWTNLRFLGPFRIVWTTWDQLLIPTGPKISSGSNLENFQNSNFWGGHPVEHCTWCPSSERARLKIKVAQVISKCVVSYQPVVCFFSTLYFALFILLSNFLTCHRWSSCGRLPRSACTCKQKLSSDWTLAMKIENGSIQLTNVQNPHASVKLW